MTVANELPPGRLRIETALAPAYGGSVPEVGSMRASGIDSWSNSVKGFSGHEKKRTAAVPHGDPESCLRHFPQVPANAIRYIALHHTTTLTPLSLQRRHKEGCYSLSEPSAHIFGDNHHERKHVKPKPVPKPPSRQGLPPFLRYNGPVVEACKIDVTRKFPGMEEELARSKP